MKRTFLVNISLLLVALLCAPPLWAATPRVGLVTVEMGKVSLNGRFISTPQLVEQGAKLVLRPGARARLQLLGGTREITLVGPRTVTVDKASLQNIARSVQRGNMASVPDIGTTTRSAALTERASEKHRGFRIVPPPTAQGQLWVFPVRTTEEFFDEQKPRRAEWSICRLEMDGEMTLPDGRAAAAYSYHLVAGGDSSGREKTITVPKSLLVPGERYVLRVTVDDKDHELGQYQMPFRLLSPEEKAILADWEAGAQQRARSQANVTPLLELASLYLDWDQMAEVRRILAQAKDHPSWADLEPGALERAKRLQETLDTMWGLPTAKAKE
jgi:hypothetical protein